MEPACRPNRGPKLGATPTLAEDAPAIAFGRSTPHAGLLTGAERVLEARLLDAALRAYLFGYLCLFVSFRVEDARIQASTGAQHPPLKFVC